MYSVLFFIAVVVSVSLALPLSVAAGGRSLSVPLTGEWPGHSLHFYSGDKPPLSPLPIPHPGITPCPSPNNTGFYHQ